MAHLRYLAQRQTPALHCAISQARMMSSRRRIGVFGGSGMYDMEGVSVQETQVRAFVMISRTIQLYVYFVVCVRYLHHSMICYDKLTWIINA